MGFSEATIFLKVGFILLIVAFILQLLGIALPYWYSIDSNGASAYGGLWKGCSEVANIKACASWKNVTGLWAVQLYEIEIKCMKGRMVGGIQWPKASCISRKFLIRTRALVLSKRLDKYIYIFKKKKKNKCLSKSNFHNNFEGFTIILYEWTIYISIRYTSASWKVYIWKMHILFKF